MYGYKSRDTWEVSDYRLRGDDTHGYILNSPNITTLVVRMDIHIEINVNKSIKSQ